MTSCIILYLTNYQTSTYLVLVDRKAFYAVATLLIDPKAIPLDGEKLTAKNFEAFIPEERRAVFEKLKE